MPFKRTNIENLERAVKLRREMTISERKLWYYLRSHRFGDLHFRRQHPIGAYITDFCSPRKKLVIEVDGSQHGVQEEYDRERTKFLESKGYTVIRFWNQDVLTNIEMVLVVIWETANRKSE